MEKVNAKLIKFRNKISFSIKCPVPLSENAKVISINKSWRAGFT